MRVGLGQDVHRLAPGRKLVLGGVPIDHDCGPVGHSDADVLLHAVIDALLGAAGLGDIGEWFPNTDAQWEAADSVGLLARTVEELRGFSWRIVNLDCTIHAERPKLAEYKPAIRSRLAELLGTAIESINVKAKTGEAVGPVGREEAITAEAVVLLTRSR